jgi:Zn-dependent metalloprotease
MNIRPLCLRMGIAIIILSMAGCNLQFINPLPSSTAPSPPIEPNSDPQVVALRSIEQDSTIPLDVEFSEGFPVFVNGRIPVTGEDAGERALAFLAAYKDLYLQSDRDLALGIRSIGGVDGQDVTIYQTYKSIPVFSGEMVISLDGSDVYATYGNLLTSISLDVVPSIERMQAEEIARERSSAPDAIVVGETSLMIFDQSLVDDVPSEAHLSWRVTLGAPANTQLFVDAQTGDILFQYSLVMDGFWLDFKDAHFTDNLACYFISPDDQTIGTIYGLDAAYNSDIDAVNGFQYSFDVYDFYLDTFGRDSYNGTGGGVEVYVHANVPNARFTGWGCDMIEFATGWVSWDVMVHEFTHAVIDTTSRLIYSNQSGALNEAYADIMGYLADPEDWLIGEDISNGAGPIRNLSNPPAFSQPDKFSNYVMTSADQGGVHTNSGILNKAAYLVTEGGDFNSWSIRGIGRDHMRDLFAAVMVSLPSGASFMDARNATVARADTAAWLTEEEACQVQNAFAAVDLGDGDRDCDGTNDTLDPDADNDFIPNNIDNCPNNANPRQEDFDGDGVGDACDPDFDGDGYTNTLDNCPLVPNGDQVDSDGNNIGDACQDTDSDGFIDSADNCPSVSNSSQLDRDRDGLGDVCDANIDNDAFRNETDLCPNVYSYYNGDEDLDGIGDACDICPRNYNPDQADSDRDGFGDACDRDRDGDGIANDVDNCPDNYNPDQWDRDGNGVGQACDENENLVRWGLELPFKVFGLPGRITRSPIPVCVAACPDYFSPNYLVTLSLNGYSANMNTWVSDDSGHSTGAPVILENGTRLIKFRPLGGRQYFLNFAFSPNFPQGGHESGSMSMSASAAGDEPTVGQAGNATLVPTATHTATSTITSTPTATRTPNLIPSITFTITANCRFGPGAGFEVDDIFLMGQNAQIDGRSQDDPIWWWVLKPGGGHCWVAGSTGTTTGPTGNIRVIFVPTPTLTLTLPIAPYKLYVQNHVCAGSTYTVTLAWEDKANNEEGYRVYRDNVLIATLGPNSTSYTDSPPSGGPYYYLVEAYNAAGASKSNSVKDDGCIF